jgi:hypothetical protein
MLQDIVTQEDIRRNDIMIRKKFLQAHLKWRGFITDLISFTSIFL